MLQCAVRSCDATILQVNIQGGLVKRHVDDVGQQLRRVGIVRRGLRPVFRGKIARHAEAKAEKAVRLSNAPAQQQHAREQQDTPRQKHQDAEQRQPKAGIQRQVP